MLLFQNKESGIYFFVDLETSSIVAVPSQTSRLFLNHAKALELHILVLPNYKTLQKFKKLVKHNKYKNMKSSELHQTLIDMHPELFV
jgi:hypothetical protein